MKKRRELDALVNGKMNRGRNNKKSHELLLENLSDSSEIEEFSLQGSSGKTVVRQRGFCHFCRSCLGVCSYFVLASCVVAIIGLLWVYVDLKYDIDSKFEDLQNQLQKYALSQKDPDEVHVQLQKLSADLESFKNDLTHINNSMSDLQTKVHGLESSIDTAAQMKDLSGSVSVLQQSYADLGSSVKGLESQVGDLTKKNKNEDKAEAVQRLQNITALLDNRLTLMELKPATPTLVSQLDMQEAVRNAMEEFKNYTKESNNRAFEEHMTAVEQKLNEMNQRITAMEIKVDTEQNVEAPDLGNGEADKEEQKQQGLKTVVLPVTSTKSLKVTSGKMETTTQPSLDSYQSTIHADAEIASGKSDEMKDTDNDSDNNNNNSDSSNDQTNL